MRIFIDAYYHDKKILMFLLLETYTFFIHSQNHKNVCDNMHTYTHVTEFSQCEEIDYGEWELIFEDDFDHSTIL